MGFAVVANLSKRDIPGSVFSQVGMDDYGVFCLQLVQM